MSPRDPHESFRVSTPLELFYDLVFVVAIAFAATALHHDIAEDHIGHGLLSYVLVFFAIWWAWVNFSWFSSAFDNDDVFFRVAMFVQMAGALIIAAGVPRAFADRDFAVITLGYVVIRLTQVVLWTRVAREVPEYRGRQPDMPSGSGWCRRAG